MCVGSMQEGKEYVPASHMHLLKGFGLRPTAKGPRPRGQREVTRPSLGRGPVLVPHLQGQGIPLGRLAHEALFFALLEFPEVLLDQESSIKLANRDLII